MADLRETSIISPGGQLLRDNDSRRILQSMLSFARVVFGAPAASTFSYDQQADELIFEAASGVGTNALMGSRMPASAGIAGMVVQTGTATIAHDLESNVRFNREFAERSGYIPNAICAAPLRYDDDILGIIEVLDPDLDRFGGLDVMAIIEGLADTVAESLHVLHELREFQVGNPDMDSRRSRISNLVNALPEEALTDERSVILEAILAQLAISLT